MTRGKGPGKGPGASGPKGRRGHQDGSIYRRESDKRWVAALTLPDGTRRSFYGATREEVRTRLLHAQSDLERGLGLTTGEQRLDRYLDDWLEAKRGTVDEATLRSYQRQVRLHIAPALGHLRLPRLTVHDLDRLYADLLAGGLAPSTVRVTHSVLHNALADAVRRDLLARNVAALARLPKRTTPDIHPLSAEQVVTLLEATRGHRAHALYATAIYTGMRVSELLGLRWADVTLDGPYPAIRVRAQLKRLADGTPVFAAPKTRQGRRQIRLAPPAQAALREHRARQAAERLALARAWVDYDLVFPLPGGKPAHRADAYDLLQRSLKRAGLPHVRFHDLRHTCATLLLLARVHPKVVSEMLGHASIGLTLDTYSHFLPDMQEDAVAALEDVIARARAALAGHDPTTAGRAEGRMEGGAS